MKFELGWAKIEAVESGCDVHLACNLLAKLIVEAALGGAHDSERLTEHALEGHNLK